VLLLEAGVSRHGPTGYHAEGVESPWYSLLIARPALPRLPPIARGTIHLIFCFALASVLLGSWVHPLRAVVPQDLHGDSSILTWDLWNVTESVLHLRNPYATELLYFPVGGTLTSHTYAPGLVPVGLLARLVAGDDPAWPIAAYRAAIWLCFALGLFASHHALRALGAAPLPALCGSVAWTFAPVFRSRALETHLVTAAFLVPAVTLALVRLIERPSPGRALVLGATTGACVCFSEYYTPFLWLGLVLLLATSFLWRDTRESLRVTVRELGWRGTPLLAVGFLLAAGPFLLNWSPSTTLRFREDQAYFESTNLAGLAIPDPAVSPLYASTQVSRWNARVRRGVGGAQAFLGFPVLLLALGGATRLRIPRHRLLLVLATAFLLLSLGPELKILGTNTRILLPYRGLMLVPPFDLARAPARLSALGLWGLVGLMALCLTRIETRLGAKKGTVAVLLVAAWCLAEANSGGPDVVPFEPPPALATLAPGAVVNVPLSVHDSFAMLLQVFHGRPIATGYLSRITAAQAQHVGRLDALLQQGPAPFAEGVRALGIGNVIVSRGAPDEVVAGLRSTGLTVLDLRSTDRED
jgi:hypothetical protein